ncbi:hypothetical protein [Halodesulfovibrio marinisediminis]|uniref:Uncharacterized protein n=1 Tax=Halodesulfovibrio marinisediminis DSM 17456 TaxID=1121457 RepID=A0A1N6I2E3_9BACT|nr:hypothetical protein [Halodesulfovibrio marinisediminis]SIO26206.1 hypothetical protein SAMN02745161_2362 [Halodesulfovibrio marinisediminis DSM 17456]
MLTTFPCSNCDSTVSFTAKNIECYAAHCVVCPHCKARNSNAVIDGLANQVGNRFRRKFPNSDNKHNILIRSEPVEDVNNARAYTFICSTCGSDVYFSYIKIQSWIEQAVICPKCSTRNCNDCVNEKGEAMCTNFVVINTAGKLVPQT